MEIIPGATPGPAWAKTLDIVMLAHFGGKQRTVQEYRALLERNRFALHRQIDTPAGISILEAVVGFSSPGKLRATRKPWGGVSTTEVPGTWTDCASLPAGTSAATRAMIAVAIAMTIGLIAQWFGNYTVDPIAVQYVRLVFIAAALVFCAYLLLRPQRRTPVRSAVLAFTVVIFFGPVVQPWYLLWALPLIAVSGLRKPWHLKAVVLGTAVVVIYGLSEPTATSDAHLDLIDSLGFLAAIAAVAFAVLASPRERSLALGSQFAHGLAPRTEQERERARQWMLR